MLYAPPPPVLEIYYSPVCAPCRLDLPIVAEFAKEDGSRVRIVILDQVPRAKADLRAVSERLASTAVVAVLQDPRITLRASGDDDGILPYARSIAPNGEICARWRGRITLARAHSLVAACMKPLILPPKQRS